MRTMVHNNKITRLMEKGVYIPCPESIMIGDDVNPDRISGEGVSLYPGTKILGKNTLIMAGSRIGYEAPVTLENVYLGPEVILNGGFFQDAVFAGKNVVGSCAHVRGGTILEEEASAAHTVGLKHTILFPFVILGSLINFCDCLMAGGTSRRDHSEVGSSFIHFNYTPNQDKATPSMLGNVHQGVMLNNRPVFLGGQGGLVGPCRIAFGCVSAAGTICRKDVTKPGRLIFGGSMKGGSIPWSEGIYTGVDRIFQNNCRYISGLIALHSWYVNIRSLFVFDFFSRELHIGMKRVLSKAIDERVKRLEDFCKKLSRSKEIILSKSNGDNNSLTIRHEAVVDRWPFVKNVILKHIDKNNAGKIPGVFMEAILDGIKICGKSYVEVIQNLHPSVSEQGSDWLKAIEEKINMDIQR